MSIYRLNFLITTAVFFTLFAGVNVLQNVGYMVGDDSAKGLEKMLPSFLFMSVLFGAYILSGKERNKFEDKKIELYFLCFSFVLVCYIYLNDLAGAATFIPNTIVLPILFSFFLQQKNYDLKQKIKKLVLSFYIVNSVVAIFERITLHHFFYPMIDKNLDNYGFRSTALQNHPLNNALITTIIMVFILISDIKIAKKFGLILLGLTSVICYGSRSSLLGSILAILVFLLRDFFISRKAKRKDNKVLIISFAIVTFLVVFYMIVNTGLGERLMNHAYFDDSANVRMEAFNVFDVIDMNFLIWGTPSSSIETIKEFAEVNIIENFWIVWVLRYGLVMTSILAVFFILFLIKQMKFYEKFDRFYVVGIFLLIASTNISLGNITVAISVYVLCTYGFLHTQQRNKVINMTINQHQIETQS